MKYIILVPDGMAGYPLPNLGNKTTMEAARTPSMDWLASRGTMGMTNNTPRRFTPASDIANMSILGLDPHLYHLGRGPLEALAQNVKLKKGQLVFRMNFVTLEDGRMKDFTANHITDADARKLVNLLNPLLQKKFRNAFYLLPGVSYRNLLVYRSAASDVFDYVPPHNITGKRASDFWPNNQVGIIMKEARKILADKTKNRTAATDIWLWGQGHLKNMPQLKKRHKVSGAMITAVDLLRGIGKSIGMDIMRVPGITGYFDTNYGNKAKYALKALKNHDLVFIHVESPDEAGHQGNIKEKIRAIENVDKKILKPLLQALKGKDFKVLLLPDHRTPIKLKTHTSDDVPFVLYDSTQEKDNPKTGFNEKTASKSGWRIRNGHELLNHFLKF